MNYLSVIITEKQISNVWKAQFGRRDFSQRVTQCKTGSVYKLPRTPMVVIYVRIRLVILDKFLITNCKTNIVANNIFILGLFASSSHKHNSTKSKSINSKQFMFDTFFLAILPSCLPTQKISQKELFMLVMLACFHKTGKWKKYW